MLTLIMFIVPFAITNMHRPIGKYGRMAVCQEIIALIVVLIWERRLDA